jgi:hypothetical protein
VTAGEFLGHSQGSFNRVPQKVAEQVTGGFGAEPGQVHQGSQKKVPEKVWEALVQSQVKFNRVPENVLEKVPESLGAKPSQVQQAEFL